MNLNGNERSTQNKKSINRRREFLRKLKSYSSAASLGAIACSSAAQGAIVHYDVPDVTITNDLSGVSQFIDIHADGPGNPDHSAPEWQIVAPGFVSPTSPGQVFNQIRIDKAVTLGTPGDERPDHSDIGNVPIPAPSVPLIGQSNQVLSLFGNPGSVAPIDPNPGYYTESVAADFSISRTTMSPSFYVGLAARVFAPNFVGINRYIGLEWDFDSTADVRYGWAQIDVTPPSFSPFSFLGATLTAYAFEMTPNTPILAGEIPEPGSLALLAAGGGGLALARRRRVSLK